MPYPTGCCGLCGSENHAMVNCPRRGEQRTVITGGTKTCEVNIGGVTTKYVSKDDYDALVLVHKALEATADVQRKSYLHHVADLELELRRARTESDWKWYHDSLEAVQRRYEAQLDMYRVPLGYTQVPCDCDGKHSYHVMHDGTLAASNLQAIVDCDKYKCCCGAVCSSRANLLSHVRTEIFRYSNHKSSDRHIAFLVAIDALYPTDNRA